MAASPQWKVYTPKQEYVAACKHVEDAAALVALYGVGATIRYEHPKKCTVWTEGEEEFPASESHGRVADVVGARRRKKAG